MEIADGTEQMGQIREIFDLCDQDNDGVIYASDFREIGQEHFDNPHQIDALLHVMDPLDNGRISFVMFCRGIQTYLLENKYIKSSSESKFRDTVQEHDGFPEGDDEDVYPASELSSASYNGYTTPNGGCAVELVVNPCAENGSKNNSLLYSSPRSISPSANFARESPTQTGRQLLRRHQLTLPDGSSQGSSPAEEEEEVGRLSGQLHELSSRLEELQEDQKGSEGYRARLKKENAELRRRLEECEDLLRGSEQANEQILHESQTRIRAAVIKVDRESEKQILEWKSQLQIANEKIATMENVEINIRAQLCLTEEEKLILEKEAVQQAERRNEVQDELYKTRELLRVERDKWKLEKESLHLAIQDRDIHIQELQQECEDVQVQLKRKTTVYVDADREISTIKKKLELSERQNHELQSRFLQEGKKLVATTSQSLATEIESASKEEVAKALNKSEETNARLNQYIDGLLTTIIEKHPEMLEKM